MAIDNPAVSVAILTYGNYTHLLKTVDSVLSQNANISELIISDDGSGKPFPKEVSERLSEFSGKLVILENKQNLGTTAHMNYIGRLCNSGLIKFISAGDAFSDQNALRELTVFAGKVDSLIVTSNAYVCDEKLRYWSYKFPLESGKRLFGLSTEEMFKRLTKANTISAVGTIFSKNFFEEYGGFDESYRLLEDWPTWLRYTRNGGRIFFLDRVTCLYAVGGSSSLAGNAYESQALRGDMIRCYEEEILPYISGFLESEKKEIMFSYDRLLGKPWTYMLKRYFLMEIKYRLKQVVKFWVMKLCRRKIRH